MTDVMVLALMIFYVNSSGYTEATVLPGVYFFAASAIITMLAYGWANSVPVARPVHREVAITPLAVQPSEPLRDADVVSMPTNPGRRHRPA
jgi:paraquat-inducible protein A